VHLLQGEIGGNYNLIACRRAQNGAIVANPKPHNASRTKGTGANRSDERSFAGYNSLCCLFCHGVQHTATVTISRAFRHKL
jgi:hypothetical protein